MRALWRVAIALLLVVALFNAYALLARYVLRGPVHSTSLATSVSRQADSAGILLDDEGSCRRTSDQHTWTCNVMDSQGSGSAAYRVRVNPDNSCWTAQADDLSGAEGSMPTSLRGCVHLWQWSLTSLLP